MVEATLKDGRLVGLAAVAKNADPKRALIFSLSQGTALGDGLSMFLTVTSPFPGVLKYKLGMMSPTHDGIRMTSVCPLKQGVVAYEHWPYPLFQVVASDFQKIDPSSPAASRCE